MLPSVRVVGRRLFIVATYLFLFLICGGIYADCRFPTIAEKPEPLLLSTSGMTLLAIIVALSAYLRQVSANAEDKRDKIELGKLDKLYPEKSERRKRKIAALTRTSENMHVAAPILMLLSLAIALRLLVETSAKGGLLQSWQRFLRIYDFLVLETVVLAFLALCILHFVAWIRDEKIRALTPMDPEPPQESAKAASAG